MTGLTAEILDLESARESLALEIDSNPDSVKAWVNYGSVCGELGLLDEANRAAERALSLDPQSREATSNLGVLRRESGRLDEAAALFQDVIARSPEFVFAHYNLGHTLFLGGRFIEAADAYRSGLRRDPEKTPNQNARFAWALLASGDAKRARQELRRALARLPAEETQALLDEAHEVLAAIEAAQPDTHPAVDAMRRIIRTWGASPSRRATP